MTIEKVNIKEVKPNPNNPRTIKDDKFKKLVKSVKEFPEMLEARPIVVDDDMIVLGGNMRLKACIEAGLKEVSIIKFSDLTEEKKKEFIVKDNVGYGEWDFDLLLEDWKKEDLIDWGLDVPKNDSNIYSSKVVAPIYTPSGEKPNIKDLVNKDKVNVILAEIDNSNLGDEDKEFLKYAAYRHYVFNYSLIADYYAHSGKEVQDLMEKSALIIIDYDKAIEYGYLKLTDDIKNLFKIDYE